MSLFFPTDEDDTGSDSEIDLLDEDTSETNSSRTERTLSQKSDEKLGPHRRNDDQDPVEERTSRTSHDSFSVDYNVSTRHVSQIKHGSKPLTSSQSLTLSSPCAAHLQTLDFSGSSSQMFSKLGDSSLFHPRHLSAKPNVFSSMRMEHGFSVLPGVNSEENRGLPSPSTTPLSPFMWQLSPNMLACQVCFFFFNEPLLSLQVNRYHNQKWWSTDMGFQMATTITLGASWTIVDM